MTPSLFIASISTNVSYQYYHIDNTYEKCYQNVHVSYQWNTPVGRFNIKMLSYQYRKFHCGDKTVWRSSYLHNGISYTGKMISLYWIKAQNIPFVLLPPSYPGSNELNCYSAHFSCSDGRSGSMMGLNCLRSCWLKLISLSTRLNCGPLNASRWQWTRQNKQLDILELQANLINPTGYCHWNY